MAEKGETLSDLKRFEMSVSRRMERFERRLDDLDAIIDKFKEEWRRSQPYRGER